MNGLRDLTRFLAIAVLAVSNAQADPVADYYKGRNVDLIVGAAAGGGFDQTARPRSMARESQSLLTRS